MSEAIEAPLESDGQAESAPVADDGQAVTTEASTPTGTSAAEDTFFDPSELSPELMSAYKQMQAAYTKKTQSLADQRRKIQEYDAFMANPRQALQQLAAQYGVPLGGQQQAEQQEFNPQSWDDVIAAAKKEAISEFQQQIAPLVGEVRNWKRSQLEQQFDAAFPQWREYEDQMSDMLGRHPSLVQDPDALLRAAIPREVFESAATQRALKKLREKTDASRVSGGSQTVRNPDSPTGPVSFQEAVAIAKRKLAEAGKRQ